MTKRPPAAGFSGVFAATAALLLILAATRPCALAAPPRDGPRPESVRVVMDDNYPPYIFRSQDGRIQGLLVDAWELWSAKTGVRAEIVATDWDKAQEIMAQGRADVIDTLFYNQQRALLYDFTKPYASLEVPVFHCRSVGGITDVESLQGFTVGAKAGDASIARLRGQGITSIREYPSYEAIIQAAARRELKVFTVDKPPAFYYLAKYELGEEFRYGFTLYSGEFHRAVAKGRQEMLALVEEGFAAFTPEEREKLDRKWLGSPLENGRRWRLAAYGLGAAAVALLALGGFNLALRRRVRAKTAELNALVAELARSEERWLFALDGSQDGVWDWDVRAEGVFYSRRWKSQLGYEEHEIGDRFDEWRSRVHPDDRESALEHVTDHLEGRTPQIAFEHRLRTRDGAYRWILTRGKVVARDEGGAPLRAIGTHSDITGRKHSEEALREALAFNAAILEHAPVGVQVFECPTGDCVLANRLAARILGFEADRTPPPGFGEIAPFASPEARDLARRAMDGQGPLSLDIELPAQGPEATLAACTFARAGLDARSFLLVISVDVSERARLHRQLILSEKMLSVGGLAAGMAHEINNPLASMLQSIQVVLRRIEGDVEANDVAARSAGCSLEQIRAYLRDREVPQLLGGAREAGVRASAIVANMLDFVRKSSSVHVPVDLRTLLDRAVEAGAGDYGPAGLSDFKRIEVLRDYAPGLPAVPCVAPQMEQVAVNILRNAAQALRARPPGSPPGRIVVRTRQEGAMARIEIEDNGPGLDDTQLRMAFDPFFSTKAPGAGTGLGLAVSYFIVAVNHQGFIEVESPPGAGARFVVRLPLAAAGRRGQ